MRAAVGRLPDWLLTAAAVLGGLALLATAVGFAAGIRPVFLRSGSMGPTMPTGTLAFAEEVPAAEIRVGDVVCVRTSTGVRVTHRVVSLEEVGDGVVLRLKGDANTAPDAEAYRVSTAYRVIGHVPFLGRLVAAVSQPWGLVVLGGVVVSLLLLLGRGDGGRPPRAGPPSKRHRLPAGRHSAAVASGVALAVLGPGQVTGAWAAPWTDGVSVTGTTLTSGTIAAPATFTCGALGLLSVQFNWAAVAGATGYTLHYGSGGSQTATIAGTSATLTAAISGGTAWVVANRAFGGVTWSSTASTTRTYTVAVVSLCA